MLYLWMPEANGVWLWSKGDHWNQAATLEQLIQDIKLYQGEETVVYFPSRDVQIIQQNINKSQYKQLGVDGVRYLLEEFVILPIDQMKVLSHFQAPDQLTVMGVAKNAVLTIQHALMLIPLKVVALLPDFLALPEPEHDETVIVQFNERLLAREHAYLGTSIDDLALYLDVAPKRQLYRHDGLSHSQSDALFAVATHDQIKNFNYQFQAPSKAKNHPFNVLPKEKSSKREVSGYWQAAAAVFVALLLVQFSYDALRWIKLKKVADQTAMVAIDQYKSWFNEPTPITEQNIRSQFESKIRLNQNVNMQALQLLSRVGPVLMQHQITANRVEYGASNLNLELVAQTSERLQTLVSQLNQQGFKAELGNIQTQNSSVIGSVKIQ